MQNKLSVIRMVKIRCCTCVSHVTKTAIAAMHGLHSVFDIGHCTVIHRDGGGVSLVDQ